MSETPILFYFVRGEDGVEYGPVDIHDLQEWVRENRAGLGTWIRYDGEQMPWKMWQEFPELILLVAQVQSAGVIPGRPELRVATIVSRIGAALLDLVLVGGLIFIVAAITLCFLPEDVLRECLLASNNANLEASQLKYPSCIYYMGPVSLVVFFVYYAGFMARHGYTPGKQLVGIRIVNQLGEKPTFLQCLIRAVFWTLTAFLAFASGLIFIPFFFAFFNFQKQALHDFIAGTFVVDGRAR